MNRAMTPVEFPLELPVEFPPDPEPSPTGDTPDTEES